jgi:hypothetical protein
MAKHPDDNAFDLEGISRFHEDRLHRLIGWMEFHGSGSPVIGLNRRLAIH